MAFLLPTEVVVEPGSIADLYNYLNPFTAERAMLLYDAGIRRTRWPGIVIEQLNKAGIAVVEFDGIQPNPRLDTVDQAAQIARRADVDLIVGLGGGSVLDAAKAVSMLIRNRGRALKYEGRNLFSNPAAPFIAIPTTCGTGSEVTWVSVLSDPDTRRKISVKGDGMYPALAIVDADVLETLPPHLIAQTGIDALTHAVEAMIVRPANEISDGLARGAIRLILSDLPRLVSTPGDKDARESVMRASTLAGMAFGNADVGAVHCLSESIGGITDLGHGLLNAVLIAPVLAYQMDYIKEPLETILPDTDAGALLQIIENLVAEVGIPSFGSLEIDAVLYEEIALQASLNGSNSSNKMDLSAKDYLNILQSLTSVDAA
jgi:alcohol dehydrogenase class IV